MTIKKSQDQKFTRAEAAEYLNVSARTMANWHSTGRVRIPFYKPSRKKVFYLKSDLDAHLESSLELGKIDADTNMDQSIALEKISSPLQCNKPVISPENAPSTEGLDWSDLKSLCSCSPMPGRLFLAGKDYRLVCGKCGMVTTFSREVLHTPKEKRDLALQGIWAKFGNRQTG